MYRVDWLVAEKSDCSVVACIAALCAAHRIVIAMPGTRVWTDEGRERVESAILQVRNDLVVGEPAIWGYREGKPLRRAWIIGPAIIIDIRAPPALQPAPDGWLAIPRELSSTRDRLGPLPLRGGWRKKGGWRE